MTVSNTQSAITYLGNDSASEWAFTFPVTDPAWLQVKTKDPTGVLSDIPATDYTLTGGPDGGSVIYPKSGAPLATGWRIRIQRVLPLVQDIAIANQEAFYPELLESRADYSTMVDQQLNQKLNDYIANDPWG